MLCDDDRFSGLFQEMANKPKKAKKISQKRSEISSQPILPLTDSLQGEQSCSVPSSHHS